jgi:hypothetical protein
VIEQQAEAYNSAIRIQDLPGCGIASTADDEIVGDCVQRKKQK